MALQAVGHAWGVEPMLLNAEGHDFFHIDMEYLDADCHTCHDGAFMQ